MQKDSLGRPFWDDFYMGMAYYVATKSPDEQTKHGAVLVSTKHKLLGIGFNGFPPDFPDKDLPRTRPDKYPYMVHAESNCLDNSDPNKHEGSTLYVTGQPCLNCMKRITSRRIGRLCYGTTVSNCTQGEEEILNNMVRFSGIEVSHYYDDALDVLQLAIDWHNGKSIQDKA